MSTEQYCNVVDGVFWGPHTLEEFKLLTQRNNRLELPTRRQTDIGLCTVDSSSSVYYTPNDSRNTSKEAEMTEKSFLTALDRTNPVPDDTLLKILHKELQKPMLADADVSLVGCEESAVDEQSEDEKSCSYNSVSEDYSDNGLKSDVSEDFDEINQKYGYEEGAVHHIDIENTGGSGGETSGDSLQNQNEAPYSVFRLNKQAAGEEVALDDSYETEDGENSPILVISDEEGDDCPPHHDSCCEAGKNSSLIVISSESDLDESTDCGYEPSDRASQVDDVKSEELSPMGISPIAELDNQSRGAFDTSIQSISSNYGALVIDERETEESVLNTCLVSTPKSRTLIPKFVKPSGGGYSPIADYIRGDRTFKKPLPPPVSKKLLTTPKQPAGKGFLNVKSPIGVYLRNSPAALVNRPASVDALELAFAPLAPHEGDKMEGFVEFSEVIYKPGKTLVESIKRDVILPPSLQKMVFEPIFTVHKKRVFDVEKQKQVSQKLELLNEELTMLDCTVADNDVSTITQQQVYRK